MQKDYYQILGVNRAASPVQVQEAFKLQCLRFYPGMNEKQSQDAYLDSLFEEIAEAYQVLSDDHKRAIYDTFGYQKFLEGFPDKFGNIIGGFHGKLTGKEVFLNFCGQKEHFTSVLSTATDYATYTAKGAKAGVIKVADVIVTVPVTLLDLFTGKTIEVEYKRRILAEDGICVKNVDCRR